MSFFRKYFPFILLSGILIFCAVYWLVWHLKPFTGNAFVFANTRPVSPWIAGYITHIHVRNNQFVTRGTPLFSVFAPPYQLKAEALEKEMESLNAKLKACEARWHRALEEIKTYRADVEKFRYFAPRAEKMFRSAAVSEDYLVDQRRNLKVALATLAAAEHNAEALKHECSGVQAQIRKTNAALALEKIWCSQTTVKALSDGYVVNMTISPGGFYKPGDILFAFIDASQWFVQANFKESELSEIRNGVRARIWLRQYPDREYRGEVCGIGWGTERRLSSPRTGVADVKKENEWFMLPQRYPVQIKILDPDRRLHLHFGGSAYVELDIPARPFRQFFWELFLWK